MKIKTNIRSIAIIDDDIDDYDMVEEAIAEINPAIHVTYIKDCEDAILHRRKLFDLVLLDINMPKQDGFSWLSSIRNSAFKNLPVVMYTNSLSPAHIARAYEEGANLYFSKPESYDKLIKGLSEILQMDWSDPFSITKKFSRNGNYRILANA